MVSADAEDAFLKRLNSTSPAIKFAQEKKPSSNKFAKALQSFAEEEELTYSNLMKGMKKPIIPESEFANLTPTNLSSVRGPSVLNATHFPLNLDDVSVSTNTEDVQVDLLKNLSNLFGTSISSIEPKVFYRGSDFGLSDKEESSVQSASQTTVSPVET